MQGSRFNDLFHLYLCLTNSWEEAVMIRDIQLQNYVSLFRVNWKRWVPKWATQLGYIFGYSKKTNLSGLLTMLLRLSIINPINNQNCQKSLGFRVKNIVKNEWKHKIKLAMRFFLTPFIHVEALRHSEENTDHTIVFKIYRTINLLNKKN